MRQCPAPGCKKLIGVDLYACRDHWFSLPKDLRDRIYGAYHAYLRAKRRGDMARVVAAANTLRLAHNAGQEFLDARTQEAAHS